MSHFLHRLKRACGVTRSMWWMSKYRLGESPSVSYIPQKEVMNPSIATTSTWRCLNLESPWDFPVLQLSVSSHGKCSARAGALVGAVCTRARSLAWPPQALGRDIVWAAMCVTSNWDDREHREACTLPGTQLLSSEYLPRPCWDWSEGSQTPRRPPLCGYAESLGVCQ